MAPKDATTITQRLRIRRLYVAQFMAPSPKFAHVGGLCRYLMVPSRGRTLLGQTLPAIKRFHLRFWNGLRSERIALQNIECSGGVNPADLGRAEARGPMGIGGY